MLFTEMSQLWTHSGLVAKRPEALQCPTPVQSHLLERTDYKKPDSTKTKKIICLNKKVFWEHSKPTVTRKIQHISELAGSVMSGAQCCCFLMPQTHRNCKKSPRVPVCSDPDSPPAVLLLFGMAAAPTFLLCRPSVQHLKCQWRHRCTHISTVHYSWTSCGPDWGTEW